MKFSERYGYKKVREAIQRDTIDIPLRNALWNCLTMIYWDRVRGDYYENFDGFNTLLTRLWLYFFERPLDTKPEIWSDVYRVIRDHFFACEWDEVYDFIEFVPKNYLPKEHENIRWNGTFKRFCNNVLERYVSGWRFVGAQICPISNEIEVQTIENALEDTGALRTINTHLQRALNFLSDRENPDYRNSIKESISAVEGICRLITHKPKATLGDCLKMIGAKVKTHEALKKSFSNLYGYTSDADGIRHALMAESNLSFEDAKFFLGTCSAFISYLTAKTAKAGIELEIK